jgi:hypothetical protein
MLIFQAPPQISSRLPLQGVLQLFASDRFASGLILFPQKHCESTFTQNQLLYPTIFHSLQEIMKWAGLTLTEFRPKVLIVCTSVCAQLVRHVSLPVKRYSIQCTSFWTWPCIIPDGVLVTASVVPSNTRSCLDRGCVYVMRRCLCGV